MAKPFPIERTIGTSAANAAQTVSSPARGRRTLNAVFVQYDAAVTVDATVTLNAGAGTAFDTLLVTIQISAGQSGFHVFETPILLSDGDAIDLLCPAGGAGRVSSAMIYTDPDG